LPDMLGALPAWRPARHPTDLGSNAMDSVFSRPPAALLGALPSQHDRLIGIDTPLGAVFVAERFSGREAVCEDFRFEVDCLSTSAFLDTGALLAVAIYTLLRTEVGHQHPC